MTHKISFTTNELLILRECMFKITLRGSDAMVVGDLLTKIQRGIDKAEKYAEAQPNVAIEEAQ